MNLTNLPIFILFLAIAYLSIVYGLLKMAEAQSRADVITDNQSKGNQ